MIDLSTLLAAVDASTISPALLKVAGVMVSILLTSVAIRYIRGAVDSDDATESNDDGDGYERW